MQFSKYLLDGSTLNSKYLTGEKIQSVEKILFATIWQGSNMGFALWAKSVYSKNLAKSGFARFLNVLRFFAMLQKYRFADFFALSVRNHSFCDFCSRICPKTLYAIFCTNFAMC